MSAELGWDLLGSQAQAARWLAAAGLLPADSQLTRAEHRGLVELREAIRDVLVTHTDRREDTEAARRLTVALASCRLAPAINPAGGVCLVSADGDPFARMIGGVAIAIADAAAAGTWPRLKSRPGQLCGWAFYDRSASARSRWCSMQVCGARSKMRAYRGRQQR